MSENVSKEQVVLHLLASGREMYGLDILRESNVLKRHSLYILLGRLEDKKLIEGRSVTTGEVFHRLPRRLYKITTAGKQHLEGSA